jgi:hypothetical protein
LPYQPVSRSQQLRRTLVIPGRDIDRGQAIQDIGNHPGVTQLIGKPQAFDGQFPRSVMIAELQLDRAQVAGFTGDGPQITLGAGHVEPLRHPVSSLRQVTAHLVGDAEHVQRTAASPLVVGAGDGIEGLHTQCAGLVDVGP